MEKRFVIFLLLAVLIMSGHLFLRTVFAPKPDPAESLADSTTTSEVTSEDGANPPAATEPAQAADGSTTAQSTPDGSTTAQPTPSDSTAISTRDSLGKVEDSRISLGSFDPQQGFRALVTLNSRGASLEHVELVERDEDGRLRYGELATRAGYLGYLALTNLVGQPGCRIQTVGHGTPAALATCPDVGKPGLRAGDIIRTVNGKAVANRVAFERALDASRAGDKLTVGVDRPVLPEPGAASAPEAASDPPQDSEAGRFQNLEFSLTLDRRPLKLLHADPQPTGSLPTALRVLSIDTQQDIPDSSIRNWELVRAAQDEAVFSIQIASKEQPDKSVEVWKTFRLAKTATDKVHVADELAYHLSMELKFVNRSEGAESVIYQIAGPQGLTLEGWWYSNKIHPGWGGAGARDVIWRLADQGQRLRSASTIYKEASKRDLFVQNLLTDSPNLEQRTLDYLGVDTQYFSAVLRSGTVKEPQPWVVQQANAVTVGEVAELKGRDVKTLNTSFQITSEPVVLAGPDKEQIQSFTLFLGPKRPEVLTGYGLDEAIEYGWFPLIAKPLGNVLHFFYWLIGNYGIAIIMLTVLVRGCMFPLGRKAAKNAQVMQLLAPEIAKIKEKYPNDMEKQAQAQRELWKKHNFNPLGGCWVMLLQLPVFIGLYRCLSVDIELRQAALIPGLRWCSNLSGPDMLWEWRDLGPAFITGETGWLGPYLNILPVITIVLFLVQQKLFTPPATDEQTRQTQRMMTFMMMFMGVMFFKVPSGLCIYFIASSLWGIAERKLVPKPNVQLDESPVRTNPAPSKAARPAARKKKRK